MIKSATNYLIQAKGTPCMGADIYCTVGYACPVCEPQCEVIAIRGIDETDEDVIVFCGKCGARNRFGLITECI